MTTNFLPPPRKTAGRRCAPQAKKSPQRATISVLVPIWWDFTPKSEPISVKSCKAQPQRLRAPPDTPFAFFGNFPPPNFFLKLKRVFSGGGDYLYLLSSKNTVYIVQSSQAFMLDLNQTQVWHGRQINGKKQLVMSTSFRCHSSKGLWVAFGLPLVASFLVRYIHSTKYSNRRPAT